MTGIGYAVVLIAFLVDFYYNVIIAWALRFFFASFTSQLPWIGCDNRWNTRSCREASTDNISSSLSHDFVAFFSTNKRYLFCRLILKTEDTLQMPQAGLVTATNHQEMKSTVTLHQHKNTSCE
jgi:hypothetical protein